MEMFSNKIKGKEPLVIIVLLYYNHLDDTIECLESLRNIKYTNYKILLVDNGSFDDSSQHLKEKYSWLDIRRIEKNCGFAGGSNFGIREAIKENPDYIFLVSNDVIVDKAVLKELVEEGENSKEVGIIGPKVFYYSIPNLIYSAGGKINFWTGVNILIGAKKRDNIKFNKKNYVDYITGCAILIKKEVFEKVGYLDEDYFLYSEDVDFCFRTLKGSYKILYVPRGVVWHKVCGTVRHLSPSFIYYMIRNQLLFMKKHAKWYHIPSFLFFFLFYFCAGYTFLVFKCRNINSLSMIPKGIYDFLRNRCGKVV